jgi:hypothetical protein
MPAEADLLCEYFITSKLNKKRASEPISAASVLLKLNKRPATSSIATSTFSTNSGSFETIDFVKYEKNPMDYLKSKYQLLNSCGAIPSVESRMSVTGHLKPVDDRDV